MTDTITAPATGTSAHGVGLTDTAADKVRSLLEQEGRDDLRLRVAVQPGECSGLIYQLYFDERMLDGDAAVDFEGVWACVENHRAGRLGTRASRSRRGLSRCRSRCGTR